MPEQSQSDEINGQKVLFRPNPGPQTQFLESNEDEVLFAGARGGGKALFINDLVLTPYGFKAVKDVKVGDKVKTPDNKIAFVIDIPYEGEQECYEFEFIDGRKVTSGINHLWNIEITNRRLKDNSFREFVATTAQIVEQFNRDTINNILVPLCEPISFAYRTAELPIDPYLLGLLLGDGCLRSNTIKITSLDSEIVDYCVNIHKYGISLNSDDICFLKPKELRDNLKKLKVFNTWSGNKFIPKKYKDSSIENRYAILQGLLDTDGTVDSRGHVSYCSISKQLAEDVQYIVRSLGGKATITTKDPFYYVGEDRKYCNTAYIVYIQIKEPSKLFKLSRKKERCVDSFNGGCSIPKLRLTKVTYKGKLPTKCITLNDPRGLFLTNDFIVTHNSFALIIDPIRFCDHKNFRALIIRKTMPELRQLIGWAKDVYLEAFPGTKWKEQEKMFTFPSGAKIEFGHLENDNDVDRYRGQEYTWIGVDEVTLFGQEEVVERLLGSLRTTDAALKTYFRATSNPNGPGRSWVKRRFVDKGCSGETFYKTYDTALGPMIKTGKWINSKTTDNPVLLERNPQYLGWLASLPEMLRRAWQDGDWNVAEGIAFPDFFYPMHVVKAFEVPSNWMKFRACDWGFTSMAVCLWMASDEDNNVYVYREYKTKLVDAPRFAANVLHMEQGEKVRYGIIDGSVGDQRGISGPTVDEQMRMQGCIWRYADKSPGSRIAGKNLIHKYLALDQFTNKPKLFIMDCCKELIEELSSLPIDKNNQEDVDTDQPDHAYDALRYGLMSRPNVVTAFDSWASLNHNPRPVVVDSKFGY